LIILIALLVISRRLAGTHCPLSEAIAIEIWEAKGRRRERRNERRKERRKEGRKREGKRETGERGVLRGMHEMS
jgi:hypothetical protein